MRLSFGKPVAAPDADLPLPRNTRRIVAVFERTAKDEPRQAFKDFLDRYLGHPTTMRIVHLTPNVDPRRTGMRVGVAEVK